MHVLGDPRLKAAHSPDVAASIQQTYGGMAHFAGTGPDGRTCRECAGWRRNAAKFARDEIKDGGGLLPRRCRTFRKPMGGLDGAVVPHMASACRHFCEAANPPPVEPPSVTRRRLASEKKAAKIASGAKKGRREKC